MPVATSWARLRLALIVGGWLGAAATPDATLAEQALPQGETSTMTAAKTTEITMPLKDGDFNLGDVAVRIGSDSSISVNRSNLTIVVTRILRKEALEALAKALATEDYVSLSQITSAGLPCAYNAEKLEISINPKVEQRPRSEITGSFHGAGVAAENLEKASTVSGFLNLRGGAAYDRNSGEDSGRIDIPVLALEGAVRLGGVVIEGEADMTWEGNVVRRGTRAIYDFPDEAVRFSVGDVGFSGGSSHVTPPMLGISIEKSFSMLQPTRNIRPTGRRSFRVERPSEIEVMLNGRPLRRLRVGPGEYDLDDLPLAAGSNNVQLLIKDDTGREEKIDFSVLFDRSLLNVGLDEWSFNAGFRSGIADHVSYDYAAPFASASYRRGLLESLTGETFLQADQEVTSGGVGALLQTPIGLLALTGAASIGASYEVGVSGAADFMLATDPSAQGSTASWNVSIELQSSTYQVPGRQSSSEDYWMHLSSSYSRELGTAVTGSVSARYGAAGEEGDDSFGIGLSLSKALDDGLTMSASASYASDKAATPDGPLFAGVSVLGRLNYRVGANSNLSVGYDVAAHRTTATVGTAAGNGAGSWSTEIEINRDAASQDERATNAVEASFSYKGNRFEANSSHGRQSVALNDLRHVSHAITMGTGIAFADGEVAVGRPVRGSFAVVNKHLSLDESRLRLSPSNDGEVAASDFLGPALISDISPYSPTKIPYDVDNLPPGYDLGSGSFDFLAPYKTGYRLNVGSGFTVTAVGVLRDAAGEPIKLFPGFAFETKQPDRKITLFTNDIGRFGAQGFGPGEWVIEISNSAGLRYAFSLPPEATGLFDLGDLRPQP
jgi:outer membrane usher protein